MSAAAVLPRMPPAPRRDASPTSSAASWAGVGDLAHELRTAVRPRVGGVQALLVREEDQEVGAQHDGHLRGQHVVVAEADLVGGRGVVLVDHRNDVPREQPAQGVARVDVAVPAVEVLARQQYLGGRELVVAEEALVVGEEAALTDGGGRLQGRHLSRPLHDAQDVLTTGDGAARDEHHTSPAVHELGDVGGEPGQEAAAEAQVIVGDRAGADLDDDGLHGRDCSKARCPPEGRVTRTRTRARRPRPCRRAPLRRAAARR